MADLTEEKVTEWLRQKGILAEAKDREMELRRELVSGIVEGSLKASTTTTIGKYVLKGSAKVSSTITAADSKALSSVFDTLPPLEKEAVVFKPSLVASVYKKLPGDSKLNQFVTTKPAAPSLELKEIINGN